ncbi:MULTISPECIES: fibronectin type III domain-containing protein [Pseudofrankia]|uniref:fibronectin type III domain-containing protein n=1 Tax=Pseudofrankia TaxID=2994363 RepID=UPI000234BFA7|nr:MULTISPECIES: fibronectin type III domain-containing protein [Pseudofrankia]OHV32067.1 hypothetical protein BCD49_30845 [Pseudofrankia sp. EUN1h]
MSETRSEATAIADTAAADTDLAPTRQDCAQEKPVPAEAAAANTDRAGTDPAPADLDSVQEKSDPADTDSADSSTAPPPQESVKEEPVPAGGPGFSGDGAEVPARGEDLATDLSGLEPIGARHDDARHDDARHDDARHDDGSTPPVARARWRGPRRGAARATSGRSRRLVVPVPAVIALAVLVVLAGVALPLALRTNHQSAFLASSGTDVADGTATAAAPPGKANDAAEGASDGVPVVVLGQDSAQPGQSPPGTGSPVGGHSTAPSSGGARQTASPNVQQPGGSGGSGVGTDPQHTADTPATQAPGTPGTGAQPVTVTAPSVPRDVTLTKLPPQASDPTGHNLVSWSPPADTGGAGVVVDYIVRVTISADNATSVNSYTVTGTSYLRSNASGRDPYTKITVAARNSAGQSAEVVVYRGSGPTDFTTVAPLTPSPAPSEA